MKFKNKKIFSIIISLCLIISIICIPSIKSNAADSIDIDSHNKLLTIYFLPYSGYQVSEAVDEGKNTQSSRVGYSIIVTNAFITEKSTGNTLKRSDVLQAGTEYSLKFEFTTKESNYPAMNYSGYTAQIVNQADISDTSFYKNANSVVTGTDKLTFTCDFTVTEPPAFDLGEAIIDLSEGSYDYKNGSFYEAALYPTLNGFLNDKTIGYSYEPVSGYDINLDGSSDIRFTSDGLYKGYVVKTNNCDISENITVYLSDESDKRATRLGKYHYTILTFIFVRYDIAEATIADIAEAEYTGAEIKPLPVITYNGKTLIKDKDYTVSYQNNVNSGNASVVVTGINEFKGEVTKNFKIKEQPKKSDNNSGSTGSDNSNVPVLNGTVHGDLNSGLWVELPDGSSPKNQWGIVNGKKYYFDANGYAAANEYAAGMWFDGNGNLVEGYSMEWKCNDTGWWIEDKSGWYPVSRWLKIDGYWYYFLDSGYMDYSEYRDGCWLGSDGAWVEEYYGGHWCSDSKGWWYEDSSGWYPQSQYLWIDGVNYYFGADGYLQ